MSTTRRLAAGSLALLVFAGLGGCARRGPPTGGPPDLEPPRLVASEPDSGATGVRHDGVLVLTFSEAMDARATGEAIALAPRVDIRRRHWSGRTVTLALAETLQANRSYTLFLGGGARDRHGNALVGRTTVVFSTADSLPPGMLEGEMVARGFPAHGTYLWCYDAEQGRSPDSTARDFDAVGLVDRDGRFRVVGLPVPGRYRLWAFADLNGNRSFEPDSDILAPVDTMLVLAPPEPAVRGLSVVVANPRAPGRVRGAVLDSLGGERGAWAVIAVAADDSLRRVAGTVDAGGGFELSLAAGTWRLRAWRDLDRSRTWQRDREPASGPLLVVVEPAGEILDVTLVLEHAPSGP